MTEPEVTLCALTHAGLATVEAWFHDPDTQRWLGGPEWPATMLDRAERAAAEAFRGAVQTGA